MSKPIHTPGPLFIDKNNADNFISICTKAFKRSVGKLSETGPSFEYGADDWVCDVAYGNGYKPGKQGRANARLLAAAYNAFDSAARKLGVNAVELAERMADGGIAALVEAVQAAREMSDWFMEHSRQADHAHSELRQPLHETAGWKEIVDSGYNGLMASYQAQFEEALAKVKGGAA